MLSRATLQTTLLFFGLLLSLPAIAEEDKAPAASKPKAPKTEAAVAPKTEAPVVPKVAATSASKAEAPATPKAAATPAAKPETMAALKTDAPAATKADAPDTSKYAALLAAIERIKLDAAERPQPRAKTSKRPALQRVSLTTTNGRSETHGDASKSAATTQAAPAVTHAAHWSYEGPTGPHAWARLSPEFAKCGNGERQSPIDIRDGMKVELEPIAFEYRPSSFRVIDNGHTLQANVSGWNSMRVMGRRFRLMQFHFHSPSEEMINGRQYDMVVHLVHKDSEGRLAVVAVLVEAGGRQPVIQAVLNNLPLEKNEEVSASSNLDVLQMLPENRRYFTYMGSLTTPPCTEDVLWIVMKQPVQATPDQLSLFTRMYPMNARPIQSASGRTIKESN